MRTVICDTVSSAVFSYIVFRFYVIFTKNNDHLVQWYWQVCVINMGCAFCEVRTETLFTIRQTSVFSLESASLYLDKWQISFSHLNFGLGLMFFVIHSSKHFLIVYFIISNSCYFTLVLGLFSKFHYHLKLQWTAHVTFLYLYIHFFFENF